MNRPQQPTTYGRQSQILRESIGGSPELNLTLGNYRNYLNRFLARLKDPKQVKIDDKAVAKMIGQTSRHLGVFLEVERTSLGSIHFSHHLEITKAYLIVSVALLGQKMNIAQLVPESLETNEFMDLLMSFSLSPEQAKILQPHVENLRAQQKSLEGILRPLLTKFQQMIAASR